MLHLHSRSSRLEERTRNSHKYIHAASHADYNWGTLQIWLTPDKAKNIHIQTFHKSIEQTNRAIGFNIVLDAAGKHSVLVSVLLLYNS